MGWILYATTDVLSHIQIHYETALFSFVKSGLWVLLIQIFLCVTFAQMANYLLQNDHKEIITSTTSFFFFFNFLKWEPFQK